MEGMLIIFQGSRGCGKTLSMVAQALEYKSLGWKIYSNFSNTISEYLNENIIMNIDKESNIKDCVIMIDELQIFFDSRNWKSNKSIKFSNFIQQIRKRNIILMGTTQYVDTVEKRIRQHVDTLIRPQYDDINNICLCDVYDLTSLESGNDLISFRFYYYATPLFPMYDTYQLL